MSQKAVKVLKTITLILLVCIVAFTWLFSRAEPGKLQN